MSKFERQREDIAQWLQAALTDRLSTAGLNGPGKASPRLIAAMRHGALNGGKRLRPLLVVQTAHVFGITRQAVLPAALAVEMIHCYSLVHDDLPAMDDDDLRRGQPTVHKAYDDATAILAGDALLTHAFDVITDLKSGLPPKTLLLLAAELSAGAGAAGMVGGQMRDLEGENGGFAEDEITIMQAMKTGALIRAAVRMGAIIGGADADQLEALTIYGDMAGRAFQLADDILDVTATQEELGKATGKDAERRKPTLVGRIGLAATERRLGDTIHHAISALAMFGSEADPLRETARYFAKRRR